MWRKGSPFALLVGMQTGATTVENSMEFPQKLKIDSTPGNISKETRNTNLKEYMYPYVHWSIICNSQDLEASQVSISKWVDKKGVVHLHNGILLGCKKKKKKKKTKILPFATTWMDLESVMLSELISQSEKDSFLTCGI